MPKIISNDSFLRGFLLDISPIDSFTFRELVEKMPLNWHLVCGYSISEEIFIVRTEEELEKYLQNKNLNFIFFFYVDNKELNLQKRLSNVISMEEYKKRKEEECGKVI